MNKTSLPKISIVIPSLNQGQFITKTIDSILTQNYPKVQIIVCDGGSKDNTLEILKSYGSQIIWTSEKDKGQSSAINKGLRLATGEIVAYLNSDDQYIGNTLFDVANTFIKNPKTVWITGDYEVINEEGKRISFPIVFVKKILRTFPYITTLSMMNFIAQPSTFWKKDMLEEIGYFDESLKYCMDFDYWMRLMHKYPVTIVPKKISAFRFYNTSKSGSQFKRQFQEEHEILKRYTNNPITIFLHNIVIKIIILIRETMK